MPLSEVPALKFIVPPFCKIVVAVNTIEAVLVNVDELTMVPVFKLNMPLLLKVILFIIEPAVDFVTVPVALLVNVPLLKFSRSAAVFVMLKFKLLVSVPPWKRRSPLFQLIVPLFISVFNKRTSPVTFMVMMAVEERVVGQFKKPEVQLNAPLSVSEPEPAMVPPEKLIVIEEMILTAPLILIVPPV